MNRTRVFIFLILICVSTTAPVDAQEFQKFQSTQSKMGSSFKITLYTSDSLYAQEVFSQCWKRVDEINLTFSDYIEESEAILLSNHSGKDDWLPVSIDMWNVLWMACKLSANTNGAFDVSLGAITKLWRRAIRHNEMPSPQEVNGKMNSSGYKWIEFHPTKRQIRIKKEGVRLDFGGIAKGFAVDEIFKILQHYEINSALIDGGGDLYIGGHPAQFPPWEIGFFHDSLRNVSLENIGIASSGSLYKNVTTQTSKYSHIIAPSTGHGVQGELTKDEIITVFAPSCTLADALATALSATDELLRDQLMKKYPNCSFFVSHSNHKE